MKENKTLEVLLPGEDGIHRGMKMARNESKEYYYREDTTKLWVRHAPTFNKQEIMISKQDIHNNNTKHIINAEKKQAAPSKQQSKCFACFSTSIGKTSAPQSPWRQPRQFVARVA